MKKLFLEDLKELSEKQVKEHIAENYAGNGKQEKNLLKENLKKFHVLIAYESVGSWGCDSSSFFLLRDKKTNKLFENNGSHCSCYGFEGQWKPEITTIDYLKSDKFYFFNGGYDSDSEGNRQKILEYIKKLRS